MTELRASRTIVKSPPELWAECSDAASLARHLGQFGEIRITRLEPETAVAWEGDRARGTVRLEAAGWGTKVILTALETVEHVPPAGAAAPADPEPQADDAAPPRQRRFARLLAFLRGPERADESPPAQADADADPAAASDPQEALTAALESLGQAHHRPFSRG